LSNIRLARNYRRRRSQRAIWFVPKVLYVRDERRNDHKVDRPFAEKLIRNLEFAAFGVACIRLHRFSPPHSVRNSRCSRQNTPFGRQYNSGSVRRSQNLQLRTDLAARTGGSRSSPMKLHLTTHSLFRSLKISLTCEFRAARKCTISRGNLGVANSTCLPGRPLGKYRRPRFIATGRYPPIADILNRLS
jgi:hypothetical protein